MEDLSFIQSHGVLEIIVNILILGVLGFFAYLVLKILWKLSKKL